ncbi:CHAT domain-containing protein [Aspergillus aurantiobrunneus]
MSNTIQQLQAATAKENVLINLLLSAWKLHDEAVGDPRIDTIDQAIEKAATAKTNSDGVPEALRESVDLLVLLYGLKHKAFGQRLDLEKAIEYATEGASFDYAPARLANLQNLSMLQAELFDETREADHARRAFEAAQRAVELASQHGLGDQVSCAANIAAVLYTLCQEKVEVYGPDQLDYAIERVSWAICTVRQNRDELYCFESSDVPRWLHNLASLRELKFERTGEIRYLNDAIEGMESVITKSAKGDRAIPRRLNTLGNMLSHKYEYTGDSVYLESAEQRLREAVSLSKDFPALERASYLNNLAFALSIKFQRQRELKDLQEAVERLRSVCKTVGDAADNVIYMDCLASSLRLLYDETKEKRALDEALKTGQKAREMTTRIANHPYRLSCANNLGIIHAREFELLRETATFDAAVSLLTEANNSTPRDDPYWATSSINLGNLYYFESQHRDLDKALQYFLQASECRTAQPSLRVKAAQMAIGILEDKNLWTKAVEVGDSAFEMLPDLCDRSLSLSDQQHAVALIAGLAAEVCSLYLQENRVSEGLQKLEFGRGLILRYLLDRKSSMDGLEQDCPDLAREYETLLSQISIPENPATWAPRRLDLASQRIRAGERLKIVIQQIRQRKGYESFLLLPSIDELTSCAVDGVIVVVNATLVRSDAIIVAKDGIRSHQLGDMHKGLEQSWSSWKKQVNESVSTNSSHERRDAGRRTSFHIHKVLKWLWNSCVSPIVQEIKRNSGSSKTDVPRVWWLGTGMASTLPFHAAGCYEGDLEENCLQQTISSYTSSIRALARSHSLWQRRELDGQSVESILAVSMPTTPGQACLDGVRDEWHAIKDTCHGLFQLKLLTHPSAERVLEQFGNFDIVHFACHGISDPYDPSQSHLLLRKESQSGPILDKLSVSDIFNTVSKGKVAGSIAYLSACSTAQVRASKFTDENLHLATAFQVAGFPSVIGSLWPIGDEVSVKVAEQFYKSLTENCQSGEKRFLVASAYRNAILHMRSELFKGESVGDPILWAAYVHMGV